MWIYAFLYVPCKPSTKHNVATARGLLEPRGEAPHQQPPVQKVRYAYVPHAFCIRSYTFRSGPIFCEIFLGSKPELASYHTFLYVLCIPSVKIVNCAVIPHVPMRSVQTLHSIRKNACVPIRSNTFLYVLPTLSKHLCFLMNLQRVCCYVPIRSEKVPMRSAIVFWNLYEHLITF